MVSSPSARARSRPSRSATCSDQFSPRCCARALVRSSRSGSRDTPCVMVPPGRDFWRDLRGRLGECMGEESAAVWHGVALRGNPGLPDVGVRIELAPHAGIGTRWHSMARITQGASLPAELLAASKVRARELRRTWSNHVVVLLERDLEQAREQWSERAGTPAGSVSHIVPQSEDTTHAARVD